MGLVLLLSVLSFSGLVCALPSGAPVFHAAWPEEVSGQSSVLTTVTVKPSPTTKRVHIGNEFTMDVYVYAGSGNSVKAAEIHLSFKPNYLRVMRNCSAGALPTVNLNIHSNSAGTIDFAAQTTGQPPTGTVYLCRIYFRALNTTGGTLLTHRGQPLVWSGAGTTYWTSWGNGTIVISPFPTPTLTATPTQTPLPGEACVSVYHDLDENEIREEGEPLLGGAQVIVENEERTPIAEYETNGVSEPYCFSLPVGQVYTVSVTSPLGYAGLGPPRVALTPESECTVLLDFAQVDIRTATPTASYAWLPLLIKGAAVETVSLWQHFP